MPLEVSIRAWVRRRNEPRSSAVTPLPPTPCPRRMYSSVRISIRSFSREFLPSSFATEPMVETSLRNGSRPDTTLPLTIWNNRSITRRESRPPECFCSWGTKSPSKINPPRGIRTTFLVPSLGQTSRAQLENRRRLGAEPPSKASPAGVASGHLLLRREETGRERSWKLNVGGRSSSFIMPR